MLVKQKKKIRQLSGFKTLSKPNNPERLNGHAFLEIWEIGKFNLSCSV